MDLIVIIIIGVVVLAAALLVFGFATGSLGGRNRDVELDPPRSKGAARAGAGTAVLDRPGTDTDVEVPDDLSGLDEGEAPPDVVPPRSLRERIAKARAAVSGYLGSILSRTNLDQETWDELEEALIRADVGIETTTDLLTSVRAQVDEQGIKETAVMVEVLKAEMKTRMGGSDRSLRMTDGDGVSVWLFVGVNGVGKTTTIGKLGKHQSDAGHTVLMAAGDTFRAAAAEQLETWADRSGSLFVRGDEGSDPAAVVFDGIESAKAKGANLVLADTAGRLHTKSNLMDELTKVRRVADKDPGDVTEVLLVMDATTGQNGLTQAKEFTDAVEVSGVVLTKLDGSAKGGVVLAIHDRLGIPVKLVGLGEQIEDLIEFDPDEFVEAMFSA
jgi:fused signal recognition particle receptor